MSQSRGSNVRNRFPARRRFLKQSAALSAGAASISAPGIVLGQATPAPIKVGLLHPVTGALAVSGLRCRDGALSAIEDINAAGGIQSLGGARLEAVLGDARSQPQVGVEEVEKMSRVGAVAIVGAYASAICLATTQAAARHGIAHLVDVGVADAVVERGLANTFRFGPGHRAVAQQALHRLQAMNAAAGNPARTVMIVHEDSVFGTGAGRLLAQQLPACGFEVLDVVRHAGTARDLGNVVSRMRALAPDLVIPASTGNEYTLLMRTMRQHNVAPMAIYSMLGTEQSNYRIAVANQTATDPILDRDHGFNPGDERLTRLRRRVENSGGRLGYEHLMNYSAVGLLADALERARSTARQHIVDALSKSTWSGHFMPYGPTRFVNGQNQGARPLPG